MFPLDDVDYTESQRKSELGVVALQLLELSSTVHPDVGWANNTLITLAAMCDHLTQNPGGKWLSRFSCE